MDLSPPTQLIRVALDRISEDRLFALTPSWDSNPGLYDSVQRIGVLQPLQLQERDGYRIVDGFQRLEAARRAALSEVAAIVRPEGDEELMVARIEEKASTRPLNDLEKAAALSKLKERFGWPERQLREFMPRLGLQLDVRRLRHYLQLARMAPRLQRSLPAVGLDVALQLDAWSAGDQEFFLIQVRRLQPGHSKLRQLLRLLEEIRAMEEYRGVDLKELWTRAVGEDPEKALPPAQRLNRAWERLRVVRFPVLSRMEEESRRLKSALKVPPQIRLNLPPFFEGDRIAFQFSVRSPEELRQLADRLGQMAEKEELKKLFDML